MDKKSIALLAAFSASIIYGLTFTIAKDVMPVYVKPFAFIVFRVLGATILFWTLSFFIKKEKIDLVDYPRIFAAAVFGVALNMLTFFKGLSFTTPINASVIMITSPIIVLVLSIIFLNERLYKRKIIGIALGLIGALVLILYSQQETLIGSNIKFGNFLVFVNAASYSLYLIIVKKLLEKYNPLSFVKWIYLFGLLLVFPFGYNEIFEINWIAMPQTIYYKIGFVVMFSTFLTYLFNLIALTNLKPTTVSVFIYLQPIIATIYALIVKSDSLNIIKIIASLLIFSGVYLVSKKVKTTHYNKL